MKRLAGEISTLAECVRERGLPGPLVEFCYPYEECIVRLSNVVVIRVGENYPFRPPTVRLSGMAQNRLPHLLPHHRHPMLLLLCIARWPKLKSFFIDETCWCCSSVTCSQTWQPTHRLVDVLAESIARAYMLTASRVYSRLYRSLYTTWALPDDVILHISSMIA